MLIRRRLLLPNDSGGGDEHTLLLLHGSALTDSSMYSQALTSRNVTIDSSKYKFEQYNSYKFSSGSINLSNIVKGTEWTVEAWIYCTQLYGSNSTDCVYCHGTSEVSPAGAGGVVNVTSGYDIAYYSKGGYRITKSSTSNKLNKWHHVALVGHSGEIKLYYDGTAINTSYASTGFDSTVNDYFGTNMAYGGNGGEYFIGNMQEIRISDIARWTSDFTPPTEPYTS